MVGGDIEHTSTLWRGRGGDDRAMDASESGSDLSLKKPQTSEYQRTVRVDAPQIPQDDGFTWTKYGQKEILGSEFSRNYYRCGHRYFKGCNARKRVQQLVSDPVSFDVTHICRILLETASVPQTSAMFFRELLQLDVQQLLQIVQSQPIWLSSSVTQALGQMVQMQSPAKKNPSAIRSQMAGRDIEHTSTMWRGRGGDEQALDVTESGIELSLKRTQRSEFRRTVRVNAPPIPGDDGFTWGKYGQKEILGSKFPSHYYLWGHGHSHGCLAKKKVQQLSDDPVSFEITYFGEHLSLETPSVPSSLAEPEIAREIQEHR